MCTCMYSLHGIGKKLVHMDVDSDSVNESRQRMLCTCIPPAILRGKAHGSV